MDPRKKTVGTANACTDNHRTVKIGYVNVLFDDIKNFVRDAKEDE